MQTIGDEMFKELEEIANEKGIRVQTLIRAVIIPEWVQGRGYQWMLNGTQLVLRRRIEKNAVKIGLRNSGPPPRVL
jgi:hypothetical protein